MKHTEKEEKKGKENSSFRRERERGVYFLTSILIVLLTSGGIPKFCTTKSCSFTILLKKQKQKKKSKQKSKQTDR